MVPIATYRLNKIEPRTEPYGTPNSTATGTDIDACATDVCVTDVCANEACANDACATDACATDAFGHATLSDVWRVKYFALIIIIMCD